MYPWLVSKLYITISVKIFSNPAKFHVLLQSLPPTLLLTDCWLISTVPVYISSCPALTRCKIVVICCQPLSQLSSIYLYVFGRVPDLLSASLPSPLSASYLPLVCSDCISVCAFDPCLTSLDSYHCLTYIESVLPHCRLELFT